MIIDQKFKSLIEGLSEFNIRYAERFYTLYKDSSTTCGKIILGPLGASFKEISHKLWEN